MLKYLLVGCISFLIACNNGGQTIKIKGSDTEVNLAAQMAESFRTAGNQNLVSVSGGGSGLGIAALLNGTTHIANSSRNISKEEALLFQQRGITLDSFIFAQDAIAFVVSETLPLDTITINQLANILSGKYTNWNSLSLPNMPINIYGRQSNSGTYSYIKKKLTIEFSPYAKQMNGNAQILEAIKTDNSGIGYVGVGYVKNMKGLKVLAIANNNYEKAISPLNTEMIIKGKYFFQRPLYQYYKQNDYKLVKPFLDFQKTKEGQDIIQASGYFPTQL